MPSVSYVDFAASAAVTEKVTMRVGVNNAFDKDPPLTASTGGQTSNGAFFAGMYDSLGRYMYVGATARF
jgi:outer membrane receptor protein involved in Fe transport